MTLKFFLRGIPATSQQLLCKNAPFDETTTQCGILELCLDFVICTYKRYQEENTPFQIAMLYFYNY